MPPTGAVGDDTSALLALSNFGVRVPVHTMREDQPPSSRGGVILLVEDDVAVAELTAALFKHAGYQVKLVHSAADALAVLAAGDRVDALFSDVVMPGGMNGFELARTVQVADSGTINLPLVGEIKTVAKPDCPLESVTFRVTV